ncbi:MAG: UDP-N-acetylglucosamine 2-epimerase, partial [Candidatus Pacebacteria bacterium]|nr:UDP-N-acetylglucosamine 2-epimerase [Candidatus Paceibacterota bacterium]
MKKNPKKSQKTLKIMVIAGARPNFMKIAPILREFKRHPQITPIIVHTGQHHDPLMSDTFFKSLGIPSPHYNFRGVSASATTFIGNTIVELDRLYAKERPDIVLVPG